MLTDTSRKALHIPPFDKHNLIILIIVSIIFSILIIYIAHYIATYKLMELRRISPEIVAQIHELDKRATSLNNVLTINNNNIEGLTTNAALMEEQKDVLSKILQLKPFINESKNYQLIDLAAQLLEINTLYHLTINSDYENAYKNAHIAKYLIEEQIKSSHYLIKEDAAALYYELKKVYPNFPRTYTRVIYTLGRIYFYNMDKNKFSYSVKLLKLSNALTRLIEKDTGIVTFESALTEQNGLLRLLIDSNEIPKMHEAIQRFKYYLNDETEYLDKSRKIIIKHHAFSNAEINTKIANTYLKIANLVNHENIKRDNYNKAFIHMIGGNYDNEFYKGAFNFVNESSTRKHFYFITLGEILLLYPKENDIDKLSEILKKYHVHETTKNNLELAEIAFKLSIKYHVSDKPTTYLADAHCKLAKIYHDQKSPAKAALFINKCIGIQNEIKRPLYHPTYKESLKLKEKISKLLK